MHEMLRGASFEDVVVLHDVGRLAASVREFVFESASLRSVRVPWPVVWLLTRFNRKHILCTGALPRDESFGDDLLQFERKVRWRYTFRNSEALHSRWRLRCPTPHCSTIIPAPLSRWLAEFRSLLVGRYRTARRAHASRVVRGNLPPLFFWALRILRRLRYTVCPYDKEAGVCLIRFEDLHRVHTQVLASQAYEEVPPTALDDCVSDMRMDIVATSRQVARIVGNFGATMTRLCSSLHVEGARHDADLKLLCKSHNNNNIIINF